MELCVRYYITERQKRTCTYSDWICNWVLASEDIKKNRTNNWVQGGGWWWGGGCGARRQELLRRGERN